MVAVRNSAVDMIQKLDPSDIEQAIALISPHEFSVEDRQSYGTMKARDSDYFLDGIRQGVQLSTKADGKLTGLVGLVIRDGKDPEIVNWVSTNGSGTYLMSAAVNLARDMGFSRVTTKSQQQYASKLQALGFVSHPLIKDEDCAGCPIYEHENMLGSRGLCQEVGFVRYLGIDDYVAQNQGKRVAVLDYENRNRFLGEHFDSLEALGMNFDHYSLPMKQDRLGILNQVYESPDFGRLASQVIEDRPDHVFISASDGGMEVFARAREISADEVKNIAEKTKYLPSGGKFSIAYQLAEAGIPVTMFDSRPMHSLYDVIGGHAGLVVRPQ